YPRIENGTLVPVRAYNFIFPPIPGVAVPRVLNELELLNFGPLFGRFGGILSFQPPLLGPRFMQFVPRPDQDGVDIAGVRPVQIRAPTGTNTGWNVRNAQFRAPNLCVLTGTYAPFFNTRAERLAGGDPRLSLKERYRNHSGFVRAVTRATRQLVRERFLLQEDADRLISAAKASDVLPAAGAEEDDQEGTSGGTDEQR